MDLIEVDVVCVKVFQRSMAGFDYVLPGQTFSQWSRPNSPAALGRYNYLLTRQLLNCLTQHYLRSSAGVYVSYVEQVYPRAECLMNQLYSSLVINPAAEIEPTAKTDDGNLKPAFA